MTLVMVAQDKGFFREEGLAVELKQFTAGKFALQALLSGACDFAVAGELPVALAVSQGNTVAVLCQVVKKTVNEVRIVARKDEGSTSAQRYFLDKRRKLATSFGGGPEFYNYEFFKYYGIPPNKLELISQRPEDMPASLATGTVDAVSIYDPFATIAEQQLGDKAVTFSDPHIYSELFVLATQPKIATQNPKLVQSMFKALDKASKFTQEHPEEAKSIMRQYTKLSKKVVDRLWPNFDFGLTLDPHLPALWQAEVEWAKETKRIMNPDKTIDFRSIIDDRYLRAVQPDAVHL